MGEMTAWNSSKKKKKFRAAKLRIKTQWVKLFFGINDHRITSPPPGFPLRLPSISLVHLEVRSWSSCGRTSRTNTFIPSLTCGGTFPGLTCSFLSSSTPAGVQGAVFHRGCTRIFFSGGRGGIKRDCSKRGLAPETNKYYCKALLGPLRGLNPHREATYS